MSNTKTHTFTCNIEDEGGWGYKKAFVAVRTWSESSQNTGVPSEANPGYYGISGKTEAIAYTLNFWLDEATQLAGKKSRPIYNLDDTDSTDLFQVDLNHNESVQVQGEDMSADDRRFRLIELDVARRFPVSA